VNLVRKTRENLSKKIIESVNFEGLKTEDVYIESKLEDHHEILVKKFIPDNCDLTKTPINIFIHGGGRFLCVSISIVDI
jgi:hypothetical protein